LTASIVSTNDSNFILPQTAGDGQDWAPKGEDLAYCSGTCEGSDVVQKVDHLRGVELEVQCVSRVTCDGF
jgi:hypothetical protein